MKNIPDFRIRLSEQGDAGYVAYMHGKYYGKFYRLGGTVEYYFMKTLTDFVQSHEGGGLWIAEADGKIAGAVGIVNTGGKTAQLRWFIVDENYQGMGIGSRLIEAALNFCRSMKYENVFLWTFRGLDSARRLYDRFGFALTEEKPNNEWSDYEIIEQRMDLAL